MIHNQKNSQIFKYMIRNEGLISFYRSFPITLFMNIPWSGIMIMTNETLKPFISAEKDHNFFTYFFCAGFSSKNIFFLNFKFLF